MTLKLSSYLLPKFSRVPFTIVLISGISTMVNGTLLNFGKRYKDNLRVIFDQWPKLHLGLDVLSKKILKGIYCVLNCHHFTLLTIYNLFRSSWYINNHIKVITTPWSRWFDEKWNWFVSCSWHQFTNPFFYLFFLDWNHLTFSKSWRGPQKCISQHLQVA